MATENTALPFKWITTVSAIVTFILFLTCMWYVFMDDGKPNGNNLVKQGFDSTVTTNKKDTVLQEGGKKILINNTTVVAKYNSNLPAENTTATVNQKLETLFKYFALFFGVLLLFTLLPRIKSFDIGKDGVKAELFQMANAINQATQQSIQTANVETGGKTNVEERVKKGGVQFMNLEDLKESNDPQKGKWGGSDKNNNRKLTATINKIPGSDWAEVTLRVSSTDESKYPLSGIVIFHLHPTFSNPNPVIIVINGIAELKLKAWGAFTVGAECDDKTTTLELDLEKHPQAFEPFKSR